MIDEDRQKDIDEWEREFSDTFTEEPGLTRLVELAMETENSTPIAQRPYNTPVMLRERVEEEIKWLMGNKRSTSEWASPIVMVRKPNGRVRLLRRLQKNQCCNQANPVLHA